LNEIRSPISDVGTRRISTVDLPRHNTVTHGEFNVGMHWAQVNSTI